MKKLFEKAITVIGLLGLLSFCLVPGFSQVFTGEITKFAVDFASIGMIALLSSCLIGIVTFK